MRVVLENEPTFYTRRKKEKRKKMMMYIERKSYMIFCHLPYSHMKRRLELLQAKWEQWRYDQFKLNRRKMFKVIRPGQSY
jgi:hypothetical protein